MLFIKFIAITIIIFLQSGCILHFENAFKSSGGQDSKTKTDGTDMLQMDTGQLIFYGSTQKATQPNG